MIIPQIPPEAMPHTLGEWAKLNLGVIPAKTSPDGPVEPYPTSMFSGPKAAPVDILKQFELANLLQRQEDALMNRIVTLQGKIDELAATDKENKTSLIKGYRNLIAAAQEKMKVVIEAKGILGAPQTIAGQLSLTGYRIVPSADGTGLILQNTDGRRLSAAMKAEAAKQGVAIGTPPPRDLTAPDPLYDIYNALAKNGLNVLDRTNESAIRKILKTAGLPDSAYETLRASALDYVPEPVPRLPKKAR